MRLPPNPGILERKAVMARRESRQNVHRRTESVATSVPVNLGFVVQAAAKERMDRKELNLRPNDSGSWAHLTCERDLIFHPVVL